MGEGLDFYIKIVISAILFFFWVKGGIRIWQLQKFYRRLKRAKPLSANSQKGDYVTFSGTVTLPATSTPFSNEPCSYWGIFVRAVFKTKQKKPGKGMQTHRPVIYKALSDKLPFLMSNDKQVVHVLLDNPLRFMVNMLSKKTTQESLTVEEAKPFIKPKYKSFAIDEFWLPENAVLHLWAVITDISNSIITVSTGTDHKVPAMLYHGNKHNIFNKIKFRFIILLVLLVSVPGTIFWLFNVAPYAVNQTGLWAAEAAALIIGVMLHRTGKIHFVR